MPTQEREKNKDVVKKLKVYCGSCGWTGDMELNVSLLMELSEHDREKGTSTVQGYLDVVWAGAVFAHNLERKNCTNIKIKFPE